MHGTLVKVPRVIKQGQDRSKVCGQTFEVENNQFSFKSLQQSKKTFFNPCHLLRNCKYYSAGLNLCSKICKS